MDEAKAILFDLENGRFLDNPSAALEHLYRNWREPSDIEDLEEEIRELRSALNEAEGDALEYKKKYSNLRRDISAALRAAE